MAIRDGLSIDLDKARTEPVVRRGTLKYVAAPRQPGHRRIQKIAAAMLVAVLVLGAAYYFYVNRNIPDTLKIRVDRTTFSPGDEIVVTVHLQNDGPRAHSYQFDATQTFGLVIMNSTGGIVAEYLSNGTKTTYRITVDPGQSVRLGEFSWNQTAYSYDGQNETWTQVPAGDYTITAYFKGSADIAAVKRIAIVE